MIQKLKLVAVVFFMLAFLVALLSVLQYHRFKTLLYEVNGSRISVPTGDLTRDIERSLAMGLALKTNAQLPTMLDQVSSKHNDILVAEIVDSQEASQTVYWKVGSLQIDHARYIASQQRSGKSVWFDPTAKEGLVQVTSIKDPLARDVAKLIVVFQKDRVEAALTQAKDYVIKICSIIFLTTLCLMMFLLFNGLKRLDRLTTSARGVLNSEGAALASAETSEIVDLAKRVNHYLHTHRDLDGHKPL